MKSPAANASCGGLYGTGDEAKARPPAQISAAFSSLSWATPHQNVHAKRAPKPARDGKAAVPPCGLRRHIPRLCPAAAAACSFRNDAPLDDTNQEESEGRSPTKHLYVEAARAQRRIRKQGTVLRASSGEQAGPAPSHIRWPGVADARNRAKAEQVEAPRARAQGERKARACVGAQAALRAPRRTGARRRCDEWQPLPKAAGARQSRPRWPRGGRFPIGEAWARDGAVASSGRSTNRSRTIKKTQERRTSLCRQLTCRCVSMWLWRCSGTPSQSTPPLGPLPSVH